VEGMKDPNKRLTEHEWQKKLVLLRSGLLTCSADHSTSHEAFLNEFNPSESIQFDCGHRYSYPYLLDLGNYRIPLFPGTKLYACHTKKDSDDYETITGEVILNKTNPGLWGLRNKSQENWSFTTPTGEVNTIEPEKVVPVGNGVKINFNAVEGKIYKS
jgi:hypothetical protein